MPESRKSDAATTIGSVHDGGRDARACAEEYAFLRDEMMENIKKQDKCFFVIYASFGILAYLVKFERPLMTIFLCFVVLILVIVLQSKIVEYRNVVYYTSSYLIFLERTCVPFCWEKRFSKFYGTCFDLLGSRGEGGSMQKNRMALLKAISAIKHFVNSIIATVIAIMAVYVSVRSIATGSIDALLCYVSIAGALVLEGFSIALTVFVLRDKSTKGDYCEVWQKIVLGEQFRQ